MKSRTEKGGKNRGFGEELYSRMKNNGMKNNGMKSWEGRGLEPKGFEGNERERKLLWL
jgi:hypothetical protein